MSSAATELYAGIDVPKRRPDASLRPTGEHFALPNDPAGIGTLLGRLSEAGARPKQLVVLEATGGFERAVAAALAAAAIPVAIVDPRQARDFARATGKLAKTDRTTPRCSLASPRPSARSPRPCPTKRLGSSPRSSPGVGRSSRR